MTDNSNGSYTATYTANTIGTINVSVWVENVPEHGLLAKYFPTSTFSGTPKSKLDQNISFDWSYGVVTPSP